MSVKLVVGLLLLMSVLFAGTAQARERDLEEYTAAGTAQAAFAFDIDDIDSSYIQSAHTNVMYVSESMSDVFGSLAYTNFGLLEKLRDISDED